MMLSMVFLQSSRASASMKRINEIFDTEIGLNDDNAKIRIKKSRKAVWSLKCKLWLQRSTGEEDLVLEGISFTAEPGQTDQDHRLHGKRKRPPLCS